MVWFIVAHLFSTLLDWVRIGRLSEQEKALEILLLRQQLELLERRLDKPIRLSKVEKLTVPVLTSSSKRPRNNPRLACARSFASFNPKQS